MPDHQVPATKRVITRFQLERGLRGAILLQSDWGRPSLSRRNEGEAAASLPGSTTQRLSPKKAARRGTKAKPSGVGAPTMADNAQMVMAGLWAKWKSPTSGEEVLSCTILTCGPNEAMGELHDMPVILAEID